MTKMHLVAHAWGRLLSWTVLPLFLILASFVLGEASEVQAQGCCVCAGAGCIPNPMCWDSLSSESNCSALCDSYGPGCVAQPWKSGETCGGGCGGLLPSLTPTPSNTNTATDTPTLTPTPQPTCTQPMCAPPGVLYCPGSCPGGCGVQCGTPTPMDTPTDTPTETMTPTPTNTLTRCEESCQYCAVQCNNNPYLRPDCMSPCDECYFCGLTPTVTPTDTPVVVCTPPLCSTGEVVYCLGTCPGGCGVQCGTPTATPTDSATPSAETATPSPTATSATALCAATPLSGCVTAAKGRIRFIGSSSDATRQKVIWRWINGSAALSDFGDPVNGGTNYRLCVYDDGVLRMSPAVAAGGTCATQACWDMMGTVGLRYHNNPGNADGLTQVRLKAGVGSAKAMVKGKGAALTMPFPVTQRSALTVQLVKNAGTAPECWETTFLPPATVSDPVKPKFVDKVP